MKYSILAILTLILSVGCSTAPLPDNPSVTLNKQVPPTYPYYAAINGIEGYVVMSFDIDTDGDPVNIKVIESVPDKIFDKAAIKALANWSYTPKVVNGVAVEQKDLDVRLDFKMG